MGIHTEIIDPARFSDWDRAVLAKDNYSFFHSAAWLRVLLSYHDYRPCYFVISDGSDLRAAIPMIEVRSPFTGTRGVGLPFTDCFNPLIGDASLFEPLWQKILEYGKRMAWAHVELRGGESLLPGARPASVFYEHTLMLEEGMEKVWKGLRGSTRRNVKKAKKNGLVIRIETSLESVREFYQVYCLTRKRHGLPPQPYSFFKAIHRHVLAPGRGIVVLAYYRDNLVSGSMFFDFGETAIYKFGGSDMKFQSLRAHNLVMWEAINWYCQRGVKTFSFGRTDPDNHGLRRFKKGWGTTEKPINYYRYDLRHDQFVETNFQIKQFFSRLFENMPIPLLRTIGLLAYRHMG